MTVNEFVKKYNLDVRNCCIEYEDRRTMLAGFIYSNDEYRKLFNKYYGNMKAVDTYDDEDYACTVIVVKK